MSAVGITASEDLYPVTLLVDILSAICYVCWCMFFNSYTNIAFLSRAYLTTSSLLCAAAVNRIFISEVRIIYYFANLEAFVTGH